MNQLHIHLVSGDSESGRTTYWIDSIQQDGSKLRLYVLSHRALIHTLHKVYGLRRATATKIEQFTWRDTVIVDFATQQITLKSQQAAS